MELRFERWVTDSLTQERKTIPIPSITLAWDDDLTGDNRLRVPTFSPGENWDVCFEITTQSAHDDGLAYDYYYNLHLEPMESFLPRETRLESHFKYNPEEWHPVGKAEFLDPWIYNRDQAWMVDCEVNKKNRNLILLHNPYLSHSGNHEGVEEGFIVFDISDRECVLNIPCIYAGIDFFNLKSYITTTAAGYFYACNTAGYKYYYQNIDYNDIKEESIDLSTMNQDGIIYINDYLIGCSYNTFGSWKWYVGDELLEVKGSVSLPKKALNYINGTDLIDLEILSNLKDEILNMGGDCLWDTSSDSLDAHLFDSVTIEDECVTGISLNSKSLKGIIPLSVFKFPHLTKLDLSGNEITDDLSGLVTLLDENPDYCKELTYLNLADNNLTGDISEVANKLPALKELNVSGNNISEISLPLSSNITKLDFSRQTLDKVIELDITNPGSYFIELPTVLTYKHSSGSYGIPTLKMEAPSGMDNDGNERNKWSASLQFSNNMLTFLPTDNNNYIYYGENEEEIATYNYNNSTFKTRILFPTGDTNFDGVVDITDLQAQINLIFENRVNTALNFTAADLIEDNYLNVRDVVAMVNLLMTATRVENMARSKRSGIETETNRAARVFCDEEGLNIVTEQPVAAFHIILEGDGSDIRSLIKEIPGFTLDSRTEGNRTHLIGYSLSGDVMPTGRNVILPLRDTQVVYAALADNEARSIKVSISEDISTGIEHTGVDHLISIETHDGDVRILNPDNEYIAWEAGTIDGIKIAEGKVKETDVCLGIKYNGPVIIIVRASNQTEIKKIILNQK